MPQQIRAKKCHRRVVVRKTDEGEEAGAKLTDYAGKKIQGVSGDCTPMILGRASSFLDFSNSVPCW